jgi:hypothetical protein
MKKDILFGKQTWVISVGGYGSFFFEGNAVKAEEMRKHKAAWEMGCGRKRLADDEEIRTGIINQCKNHPNFGNKDKFYCDCENCKK